jgi:protein TonB
VISPSAATSANQAATKPPESPPIPDESVISPSAATSANQAATEPAQSPPASDESVISPSTARSANQAATKAAQAPRVPGGSVISPSAAKAVATYAPHPEYPQQARSRRIAGSGVCVVSVDPASGSVTQASMAQSTGSPLLDKSVLSTVRTWKFKPRTVSRVRIPVEFR